MKNGSQANAILCGIDVNANLGQCLSRRFGSAGILRNYVVCLLEAAPDGATSIGHISC